MTENKTLNEIKTLIEQWEQFKQDKKVVNNFFKIENKIAFIDKLNNKVLNQWLKSKDKSGFIMIYDKDIFKLYLKKYYEQNNIFFIVKNDKLFLLYDNEQDFLKCSNFKEYALNVLKQNKEKEQAKKEQYKKAKLNIKLDNLTPDKLNALIYQAREQLKQVKNKQ